MYKGKWAAKYCIFKRMLLVRKIKNGSGKTPNLAET